MGLQAGLYLQGDKVKLLAPLQIELLFLENCERSVPKLDSAVYLDYRSPECYSQYVHLRSIMRRSTVSYRDGFFHHIKFGYGFQVRSTNSHKNKHQCGAAVVRRPTASSSRQKVSGLIMTTAELTDEFQVGLNHTLRASLNRLSVGPGRRHLIGDDGLR
ncbi:hypothetical protein EVAR_42790_1 [Eumeta japonica]|uniref:Uncharacterized protein n=1 Tax=Eumeta variegata TaxID=151549 RepID=A0A4C1WJI2_EUMVA|nr:hypothetical protein EVAR_42790_1 [Eumeta japonica]